MINMLQELDTSLFYFFNHTLHLKGLVPIYQFVSGSNEYIFLILVLLLFRHKKWAETSKIIGIALIAVALSDLSGFVLKELIARTRPCHVLDDVNLIAYCGNSFSMPSNHGVNTFAMAGTIFFFSKDRLKYAFIALAALVALSRPVVGVHYPSDVLVGSAIGFFNAWLIYFTFNRISGLNEHKRPVVILGISLLAFAAYRAFYITHSPVELSPHEASLWGLLSTPGTISHTPFSLWLVSLGTSIFGNTVFGVRVFAVILSALTSICIYALGKEIYDRKTALFAALSYQIIPLFMVHGILMTNADVFIFFWALSLYLLHTALNTSKLKLWGALGVVVALGALSSLQMLLFPLLVAGWMFSDKSMKKHDMKGPVAAVFVLLLVSSPFLVIRLVLKGTQPLVLFDLDGFEFIISQVLIFSPILFVLMCLSLFKKSSDHMRSFNLWFSVPIFLMGFVLSLFGGASFSAALPAYITGLLALSNHWFVGFSKLGPKKRSLVISGIALALVTVIAINYPHSVSTPPKLSLSAGLKGWQKLTRESVSNLKQGALILTDSREIASELEFYKDVENSVRLYPQELDVSYVGVDAVFVASKESDTLPQVQKIFSSCSKREHITRDEYREPLREYVILDCREYTGR